MISVIFSGEGEWVGNPCRVDEHPYDDLIGSRTYLPPRLQDLVRQKLAMAVIRRGAAFGWPASVADLLELILVLWLRQRAERVNTTDRPTTLEVGVDVLVAHLGRPTDQVVGDLVQLSKVVQVTAPGAPETLDHESDLEIDFWPLIANDAAQMKRDLNQLWFAQHILKLRVGMAFARIEFEHAVWPARDTDSQRACHRTRAFGELLRRFESAYVGHIDVLGAEFDLTVLEATYAELEAFARLHDQFLALLGDPDLGGERPFSSLWGEEAGVRVQARREARTLQVSPGRGARH